MIKPVTLRQQAAATAMAAFSGFVVGAGLGGAVHFGKNFTRYFFREDGKIVAEFGDGSRAIGDVLVGTDGGSSRVRRLFLPQAQRVQPV